MGDNAYLDVESGKKNDSPPENTFLVYYRKFSYFWGSALCLFSLIVVLYGIAKQWNNPPWDVKDSHPVLECIVFLMMLYWIALLEGMQISIVGLQNVNMEAYKESHPKAYKCCKWVHQGPNVEKFLVGRQFLLLFNGFLASRTGGANGDINFEMGSWEWNDEANQFFWLNSALLLIVIVAFAQLPTQLVAADKMLGFFELPHAAYYTVLVPCMVVEAIGVTHSSYLLKDVLVYIAKVDTSTEDPAKQLKKDSLYYARCVFSIVLVIFSGLFIGKGIASDQTPATKGPGWEKLPGGAAVVIACFFVFVMASAEGLQVALLAISRDSTGEFKKTKPLAYRTAQLAFAGRNMQAFLVGRQFILAMQMVLLAKVTGYAGKDGVLEGGGGEDWGMSKEFNEFLQTGFCRDLCGQRRPACLAGDGVALPRCLHQQLRYELSAQALSFHRGHRRCECVLAAVMGYRLGLRHGNRPV
jgi:hypothetical protein